VIAGIMRKLLKPGRRTWTIQGETTAGRSHISAGGTCQDKVYSYAARGAYAIALSDGAGSVEHSETGAQCAVTAVCQFITANFDRIIAIENAIEAKRLILDYVLEQLRSEAARHGYELDSLAGTLLFVAIKDNSCIVGHIGDGVICGLRNDELFVVSAPSNGEFANSTTFTTSPGAMADFRIKRLNTAGIEGFCLMSDGSGTSLYDNRTAEIAPMVYKVILATKLLSPEEGKEYFSSLLNDLLKPRTSDDCSIIAIARKDAKSCKSGNAEFARRLGLKDTKRIDSLRSVSGALSESPQNITALSKKLHVKSTVLKRRLALLVGGGMVVQQNGRYHAVQDRE